MTVGARLPRPIWIPVFTGMTVRRVGSQTHRVDEILHPSK